MLPCSKNHASTLFRELQAKGFLKATEIGAFSFKVRHSTEWRLAMEMVDDHPASKEFMAWKPDKMKNPVLPELLDGTS